MIPNRNETKLSNIIDKYVYITLNTDEHTRLAEVEGQLNSAVDLTIVSGSLLNNDLPWEMHNDAIGSNHSFLYRGPITRA